MIDMNSQTQRSDGSLAGAFLRLSPRLQTAMVLLGAMLTNTYFARVVRIQEDRGQTVIRQGPYQIVRHPGYAGFIPAFFGMGLALGSWLAFGMMVVSALLLILRTALEDHTLHQELEGYAEYAKEVRYRLLPGIW